MNELVALKAVNKGLHISWAITYMCTHKCSYCPEILHSGQRPDWLTNDIVENFFKQIVRHYGSKVQISFAGGEPTVLKSFIDIIDLSNKYFNYGSGMTTNLSRSVRYWEDNAGKFKWIAMSFHPEFAEVDEFLEKAKAVSKQTRGIIRVMMHPNYWDKSMALIDKFKNDESIICNLEVVFPQDDFAIGTKFVDLNFTDEQIKFMHEFKFICRYTIQDPNEFYLGIKTVYNNGNDLEEKFGDVNDLVNKRLTKFKDWVCYIGLEELHISMEGFLNRGNCWVEGIFGNVKDDNIIFPKLPIICNKEFCHCTTDIFVTKFNPKKINIQKL